MLPLLVSLQNQVAVRFGPAVAQVDDHGEGSLHSADVRDMLRNLSLDPVTEDDLTGATRNPEKSVCLDPVPRHIEAVFLEGTAKVDPVPTGLKDSGPGRTSFAYFVFPCRILHRYWNS